jgi:hypothetical protein
MTMNGSLPPSSSTLFLIRFAAPEATLAPAGSLPVSVAALIRSSSSSSATRSAPISSVWSSPSVKPASRRMSSMASADCGTFEACLSSPTFPAISAGAANRNTCQKGKFHGITARIAPRGSKRT